VLILLIVLSYFEFLAESRPRVIYEATAHVGSKAPDCVFLDLNMPRVDGLQMLTTMRADKNLRAIPVVILSTSIRQVDKTAPTALGYALHREAIQFRAAGHCRKKSILETRSYPVRERRRVGYAIRPTASP
jgi:CheY-like chemotaxis protein